jgi:hypothetical protein
MWKKDGSISKAKKWWYYFQKSLVITGYKKFSTAKTFQEAHD